MTLRIVAGTIVLVVLLVLGLLVPMGMGGRPAPTTSAPSTRGPVPAGSIAPSPNSGASNSSYTLTFRETGLPNGTAWQVNYNSTWSTSNGTTITFPAVNGTYDCGIYEVNSQAYLTYTPQVIVNMTGTSQTVNVTFEKSYLAWFNASGLPTGGGVGLDITITAGPLWVGSGFGGSSQNISYPMLNGTYSFNASAGPDYVAVPTTGSYTVNGSAVYIPVHFVPNQNGSIWFSEIGLLPGTNWSVNVTSSNDSQIELGPNTTDNYQVVQAIGTTLREGAYSYSTTAPAGYAVAPSSGNFTLTGGQQVDVCLVFTPSGSPTGPGCWSGQYEAIFQSTGLPNQVALCVNVTGAYDGYPVNDGGCGWDATHGGAIGIGGLYNGTYHYSVPVTDGLVPSPSSGTFVIDGGTVWVNISFEPGLFYQATFNESGLSAPFTWSVVLNGTSASSATSALVISGLGNGSYSYSVPAVPGYVATPRSGSLVIAGTNVTVPIQFVLLPAGNFSVSFVESGLPVATNWSVSLSSEDLWSGGGTTVTFVVMNGTYTYAVGSAAGLAPSPVNGSVRVAGVPVTVDVTFASSATSYGVALFESGLPAGTPWNATLAGVLRSSTTDQINFSEPNGTFGLEVASNANYSANYTTSVTVAGRAVVINVTFSVAAYPIELSEVGLPAGDLWNATATNVGTGASTLGYSTGSVLTLRLRIGEYDLYATGPAGYRVTLSRSEFSVDGSSLAPLVITFSLSASAPVTVSYYPFVVVGILAVTGLLAAVGIGGGVRSRYRRDRATGQRWVEEWEADAENARPPTLRRP